MQREKTAKPSRFKCDRITIRRSGPSFLGEIGHLLHLHTIVSLKKRYLFFFFFFFFNKKRKKTPPPQKKNPRSTPTRTVNKAEFVIFFVL